MDPFVIEIVEETRYEEFINFIYREFFPRERLAIASGLDKKPYYGMRDQFREWLAQNLSLAAIDSQTNRIVAIAFNLVFEKSGGDGDLLPDYGSTPLENRNIWMFIDHLEENYNVFEQLKAERGMELLFLCVQESHCGKGLARQLTRRTMDLAVANGCSFIKSNPSTVATCQLFKTMGFETINQMRMSDYLVNHQPAFPNASPDDLVQLVVKKL